MIDSFIVFKLNTDQKKRLEGLATHPFICNFTIKVWDSAALLY